MPLLLRRGNDVNIPDLRDQFLSEGVARTDGDTQPGRARSCDDPGRRQLDGLRLSARAIRCRGQFLQEVRLPGG